MLLLLAFACSPHAEPHLAWVAEARLTGPDVRVLPVLSVVGDHELDLVELGTISWDREQQRRERTAQMGQLPREVGLALPGAVNIAMGDAWTGQFSVGRYPLGTRARLADAIEGHGDLDASLAELARNADGEAVLVTWVSEMSGTPLTREALPGEVVQTAVGPVVVDIHDEAYRIRARIGVALVAPDGELVLRYDDAYEALLSSHRGPERAGRDLARALAVEVATVWPADPRLGGPSEPIAANGAGRTRSAR